MEHRKHEKRIRAAQEAILLLQNPSTAEDWKEHVEAFYARAKELTLGDRNIAYGQPDEDYAREALRSGDTPVEVVRKKIDMKINREENLHQRDNCVDLANYAVILDFVEARLRKAQGKEK